MNPEQVEELEKVQVHIDQAKLAVKMADDFEVLRKVPEFDSLITKGFMENEASRIASIITDPSLQDEVDQRELLGAIKAIGYLGDYLRNIQKRGTQMKQALESHNQMADELRNPTLDEGK